MGTLGIAWTFIDQAEGQDGWILAKFVCPFLCTESRPIDSHLDRTSLVNKRFKYYYVAKKTTFSWGTTREIPSPLG